MIKSHRLVNGPRGIRVMPPRHAQTNQFDQQKQLLPIVLDLMTPDIGATQKKDECSVPSKSCSRLELIGEKAFECSRVLDFDSPDRQEPINSTLTVEPELEEQIQRSIDQWTDKNGSAAVNGHNKEMLLGRIMSQVLLQPSVSCSDLNWTRFNALLPTSLDFFSEVWETDSHVECEVSLGMWLRNHLGRAEELVIWVIALKLKFTKRYLDQILFMHGTDGALATHLNTLLSLAIETHNTEFINTVIYRRNLHDCIIRNMILNGLPEEESVKFVAGWMSRPCNTIIHSGRKCWKLVVDSAARISSFLRTPHEP